MKSLTIKQTAIANKDRHLDYVDFIVSCLESQPKDGFTIEEMSQRMSILKKVRAFQAEANEMPSTIDFEDAEANKILQCIESMNGKWAFMHEDILNFVSDAKKDLA